jgi:hypothetical protein
MSETDGDQTPKMVPESDLLAVKSKVDGLEAQVKELTQVKNDTHDKYLQAQVANEDLTKQVGQLQQDLQLNQYRKEQVDELQGKHDAVAASHEELKTKHLGLQKQLIASVHGVSTDKLEGKTAEELVLIAEGMALGGKGGTTQTTKEFDLGSTSPQVARQTALEQNLEAIARAKERK